MDPDKILLNWQTDWPWILVASCNIVVLSRITIGIIQTQIAWQHITQHMRTRDTTIYI